MKSDIFVPQTLKVGFCQRDDTYTKRLAYVIYYDEKGTLRKEASWESWRDKAIPPAEYPNEPTEGFVLNKKVGGHKTGWDMRQAYVRVYDPRGFEFEITVPNLLYILECTNSIKGKGLEGKFVYGWSGTDLVLLPTSAPEYARIEALNKKRFAVARSGDIRPRDLKEGHVYRDKNGQELVFLGKHMAYEMLYSFTGDPKTESRASREIGVRFWFEPTDNAPSLDSKNGRFPFGLEAQRNGYVLRASIPKGFLLEAVAEEPVQDYAERLGRLRKCATFSPFDPKKDEFVPLTAETFADTIHYAERLNPTYRL